MKSNSFVNGFVDPEEFDIAFDTLLTADTVLAVLLAIVDNIWVLLAITDAILLNDVYIPYTKSNKLASVSPTWIFSSMPVLTVYTLIAVLLSSSDTLYKAFV